ncbi:MAG: hypothetical protein ACR2PZ_24625 [Pseudomonadales bacterium]
MKYWAAGTLALAMAGNPAIALADDDDHDEARVFQTAVVQPNQSNAEGAAWLKRTPYRLDGRVMAKVDRANYPYSIWWVIFNNPSACLDPGCGLADLMNDGGEAAQVAIFNASGAISAASGELKRNGKPAKGGVLNVDLSVLAGEGAGVGSQNGPGDPTPPPFTRVFKPGYGLCAEVHVDINEHDFDGDWVQELTYPENPQAFAIFRPVPGAECGDDD